MFILAFLAVLGIAVFGVISIGWASLFGTIPLFAWLFVITWMIYTYPLADRLRAKLSEMNLSYTAGLILFWLMTDRSMPAVNKIQAIKHSDSGAEKVIDEINNLITE